MPLQTPDAPGARAPDVFVRRMRALVMAALVALVALGAAWELWLAPTGRGTLALKVLPLLPCVPGVARHRLRTYRWLALLVWLYFMEGVVRATSEAGPGRWLAVAEVALSLALFSACSAYIRHRLKFKPEEAAA